jgi:hypothetical protein
MYIGINQVLRVYFRFLLSPSFFLGGGTGAVSTFFSSTTAGFGATVFTGAATTFGFSTTGAGAGAGAFFRG